MGAHLATDFIAPALDRRPMFLYSPLVSRVGLSCRDSRTCVVRLTATIGRRVRADGTERMASPRTHQRRYLSLGFFPRVTGTGR